MQSSNSHTNANTNNILNEPDTMHANAWTVQITLCFPENYTHTHTHTPYIDIYTIHSLNIVINELSKKIARANVKKREKISCTKIVSTNRSDTLMERL